MASLLLTQHSIKENESEIHPVFFSPQYEERSKEVNILLSACAVEFSVSFWPSGKNNMRVSHGKA